MIGSYGIIYLVMLYGVRSFGVDPANVFVVRSSGTMDQAVLFGKGSVVSQILCEVLSWDPEGSEIVSWDPLACVYPTQPTPNQEKDFIKIRHDCSRFA